MQSSCFADPRGGQMNSVSGDRAGQGGIGCDRQEQSPASRDFPQRERQRPPPEGIAAACDYQRTARQGVRSGQWIGQAVVIGEKD